MKNSTSDVKTERQEGSFMNQNQNRGIDALHGGLAVYDGSTDKFVFQYCSDTLVKLICGDRSEFEALTRGNALQIVCECDREQVEQALRMAREEHTELSTHFWLKSKGGRQIWCHLVGWMVGEEFQVLFSGLSPEVQLFQHIVSESADDIYVIDSENYDLLYANSLKSRGGAQSAFPAGKCYEVLHGRTEPCEFCSLYSGASAQSEGVEVHELNGRTYTTRTRVTDWNGTPAYIKYVRDTTEELKERRAKERLEQYFQTAVKYLPGGMAVIRHDVDGSIKPEYLSEGFSEMLGMRHEDAWAMYQESALAGVHPDDQAFVRENLDRCISEKREKYELEYRLQKGNGEYIWVKTKVSVIQCDGDCVRVYADYHDVTAEKKVKEQLRQQYQEQIHQHYQLAGPDALILGHCNITKNQILEIVDHTDSDLLSLFGSERENFFTGLGTLIVDQEERKTFYSKYLNKPSQRAYAAGDREIVMPCFIDLPKQRAGRYVQFKVRLVEMPDTGDITGILTVTDITKETIRDKIFLTLSSAKYDLVADVDLLTDQYEIVSGGDDNIPEMTGCNSERIRKVVEGTLAKGWGEEGYVEKMLDPATMLERLKGQGSYSFIYSVYNAAGEIRTKKMHISAIDLRLGRVCFIRADVTDVLNAERKAKEELERALREAENASKVKSDFLSSMSHDIRTPMNAIVGMTTLALANLDNTDKLKDYLYKISVSSQHLLSLINDILDMSQIEQSKIHLNLQTIHIEELIGNISSIMTSQAENIGLCFKIETSVFQHIKFTGDALRIKQILINLLSNAFKFTLEGGMVIFRVEEINAERHGCVRYRFTVQDTGIGISDEFLNRLFEPFNRSKKVSKVEGTGLGLSITKGLVDLMGGTIQVESKLGQGTKFEVELEFDLPSDQEQYCRDVPIEVEPGDLSGYHFLLVEDNEINSEILGELLQMWGATFTLRCDGLQAVNEFDQSEPGTYDAIFMDIQMPVMNGYEAAREIRKLAHPDAASIPIFAMTANAFAQDVRDALEAGMNAHISKPVEMDLLYSTVSKYLKKNDPARR